MYPVPPSHESNLKAQNWEVCKPVTHIRHLYALAPNLCMQKHMTFSPFHTNHIHLGSSQTTHEISFPGPLHLQQFKPVLASCKILKNLKFPTFCTNLTYFHYKFLKDFLYFQNPWTLRITMVSTDPGFIQYLLS